MVIIIYSSARQRVRGGFDDKLFNVCHRRVTIYAYRNIIFMYYDAVVSVVTYYVQIGVPVKP